MQATVIVEDDTEEDGVRSRGDNEADTMAVLLAENVADSLKDSLEQHTNVPLDLALPKEEVSENDKRDISTPHYCYLISNMTQTYIGYTMNLGRRLRQHNGLVKGGAKATRSGHNDPFTFKRIIGGFASRRAALSFEYYWKHIPATNTGKYRATRGLKERIERADMLLQSDQWHHLLLFDVDLDSFQPILSSSAS